MNFFIMSPVFSVIYDKAMLPYQNEEIGIEEAIKEAEIPIVKGDELSSYLQKVAIGSEVPQELFESVAIVLSWVYWLQGKKP